MSGTQGDVNTSNNLTEISSPENPFFRTSGSENLEAVSKVFASQVAWLCRELQLEAPCHLIAGCQVALGQSGATGFANAFAICLCFLGIDFDNKFVIFVTNFVRKLASSFAIHSEFHCGV